MPFAGNAFFLLGLNPYYVGGSGATVGLFNVEGHPISFRKGFESLGFYGRKMNKDIPLTSFLFDKTKPFLVTEPFNNTVSHFCCLLKKM
jgi:hypothetical protein